jgi:hypothetical protein
MENGGNAKVNAIFEARLPQSGVQKPSNHADGPTRERFIRDKYERRKFYDPNAFIEFQQPTQRFGGEQSRGISEPSRSTMVGPPSDVARQRLQERNRKLQKSSSTASDDSNEPIGRSSSGQRRAPGTTSNSRSSSRKGPVAKAPVSAPPPTMDLLDFLSPEPVGAPAAGGPLQDDFFDFNGAGASNVDAKGSTTAPPPQRRPQRTRSGDGLAAQPRRNKSKEDLSAVFQKKSSSTASEDILSLYQPHMRSDSIHSMASSAHLLAPSNQQSGGYDLGSITGMMGTMSVQHGANPNNAGMQPSAYGVAQQQQQQQPMFTPQQMMQYQQMMMMQQQQQQMMMMQQRGYGAQQPLGGVQQAGISNNPMMMMGSGPSSMAGSGVHGGFNNQSTNNGNNVTSNKRNAKQPEKEDPFAQFAMNAFR